MHGPRAHLLAAVALALVGFAWLVLRVRRGLERARLRRRFHRAARGQRRARALLEREGFNILAEEQVASGEMVVDGEPQAFEVRVDFLVERDRRSYAVEVKTGAKATDPLGRATRRQLGEYARVLGVDGVYLLDMETPRLVEVSFPGPRVARAGGRLWPLLLGVILGAVAMQAFSVWVR